MKRFAVLSINAGTSVRGRLARLIAAAIPVVLACVFCETADAQPDAQSSQTMCLSILDLGLTANAVKLICKLKTGGSRSVVAKYNQSGCKEILSAEIVKQHVALITKAVVAKEEADGRSKFCAGSAKWDRDLAQHEASE